jgi:hypothetical protein
MWGFHNQDWAKVTIFYKDGARDLADRGANKGIGLVGWNCRTYRGIKRVLSLGWLGGLARKWYSSRVQLSNTSAWCNALLPVHFLFAKDY